MGGGKNFQDALGINTTELSAKCGKFSSWLILGMVNGSLSQEEIYEHILSNFTANERLFFVWSYLSDTTEKILDELDEESDEELEKIKELLKKK